ncbi:hypothetical protein [Shimia abyssi]|uniref:hypothetical protein n=1 Tax=Shimia abyssi TaxID=1662395 RepID=UPI001056FE07|nr:hypothetical protein [Shimia abyssi]
MIAFISILGSVISINHTMDYSVKIVLTKETDRNDNAGLSLLVTGNNQNPSAFTQMLSTVDEDMTIHGFLNYVTRVRPDFTLSPTNCSNLSQDIMSKSTFSKNGASTRKQVCYDAQIRRSFGNPASGPVLITSLYLAINLTASSAISGVFDLIVADPTKLAATFVAPPTPSEESRLDDSLRALLNELASVENSNFQASLVLSPFIMASVYFTIMIYTLGAVIFAARKASLLARARIRIPLMNPKKTILSLSVYVNAFAVTIVCIVFFNT